MAHRPPPPHTHIHKQHTEHKCAQHKLLRQLTPSQQPKAPTTRHEEVEEMPPPPAAIPPHSHQRLPTTRHITMTAQLKHPPHKCIPTHTPLLQTPTPNCDGGHAHKFAIAIRFLGKTDTLSDKRCLGGCCGLMCACGCWVGACDSVVPDLEPTLLPPPPPPHAHK